MTLWRGPRRSTRLIFDHRETVMGLRLCRRLARTVCERLGERWRDGAGCCLTSALWPPRNQQTPYQYAHRMQISSTHRDESLKSHAKTARGLSTEGQLATSAARRPMHAEHVPLPMHRTHPTVHVRLASCATNPLASKIEGWGNSRSGGSTYGATNDRRRRLTGMRGAR